MSYFISNVFATVLWLAYDILTLYLNIRLDYEPALKSTRRLHLWSVSTVSQIAK